jgi:ribosomal protein S13
MVFVFKEKNVQVKGEFIADVSKTIYGIGKERACYLNNLLGLGKSILTSYFNFYYFEAFCNLVKLFFITDERLKVFIKQRMFKFLELKIRRGIRFFRNLPIRGQSTHGNAKQRKYLKRSEI